jgi:hypothetical protein
MDRLSDLDINCRVRRVLVRHWIDLGKICVRTTSGVVRLSGSLVRLHSGGPALDPTTVVGIMAEIRRIQDIRRIQASFNNWVESIGTWVNVTKQTSGSKLSSEECITLECADS